MSAPWSLLCSGCNAPQAAAGLPTVCPACGAPWLVRYDRTPPASLRGRAADRSRSMWRYREWLPLLDGEEPVTLGEGGTPLIPAQRLAAELDVRHLWIKDESTNPTGSFKARGLSAAVTRARSAPAFTIPTAGNAGVALSAYGRRAGIPVHVFAPHTTPPRLLEQMRIFGAELTLLDGHIGDCGKASRAFAAEHGALDLSTLREPYRIEGKKTLGIEIAEQLGWSLPDVVVYPTGGGTGLIGMWIAFRELLRAGWCEGAVPRLFSVQATGCAPVVRAFRSGSEQTEPWPDPTTVASGLRVPAPLGGSLMLRALRETGGAALGVSDADLVAGAQRMASTEAIDACPEGGATVAALETLLDRGLVGREERIVLFNTGAGWLYRD